LQLECTGKKLSWPQFLDPHYVSHININEGTMGVKKTDSYVGRGYFYYTSSAIGQELNWVVANLTCQEAPQNNTTYACISLNSECLGVVSSANEDYDYDRYIGYRCKCNAGFQGNPYVQNGCQGSHLHKNYMCIL
jgi:hypothetical protein